MYRWKYHVSSTHIDTQAHVRAHARVWSSRGERDLVKSSDLYMSRRFEREWWIIRIA